MSNRNLSHKWFTSTYTSTDVVLTSVTTDEGFKLINVEAVRVLNAFITAAVEAV